MRVDWGNFVFIVIIFVVDCKMLVIKEEFVCGYLV